MEIQTADLCDRHEAAVHVGLVQVACPLFHSYGGRRSFAGPIATLKLFEDNSLVRSTLEKPGNGRVLVVDGGGSLRCALVGDQIAQLAVHNRWSGILVFGCIRDSQAIAEMDIGLMALGTHPLRSVKRGLGDADVAVSFAGVRFVPGHHLYADADGILVAADSLA